ncbi:MAG: ATP-binding protein [Merismopedia sp. SIO2A8]|nr:ATP-binding protein [Symploca sp. SIO2B6]NET49394.1 ATP-binding protein [Merismopedia sp. SIO2A8]
MPFDLSRFYEACNPSYTLKMDSPGDRKYYIDFSSVRGSNTIREMERTIARISPNKPTCQLFTGHIGCGKSTELMRLKDALEKQKFHVVYFESSHDLDMADVDVTDILLAIARQVSESLEAIDINLKPGYFINLFREVGEMMKTPVVIDEISFSAGIASITAKTKDAPGLRSQLRQFMEPRTNGILEAINKELLLPATEALKASGRKGLVVMVDNLDRVDNSMRGGRIQPAYLFVDRGEQLKKLQCHLVYTVPLILIFSNDLGQLTNRFGVDPKVLPMIPIQLRDGQTCDQGMALLRQMVMARAFPDANVVQRLEAVCVTQVFDSMDTLNRLCSVSGGHVRNLLALLYRCIQRDDPPISRRCLESVIQIRANELRMAVTPDEEILLKKVMKTKDVRGEEGHESLLRSMFVFEYRTEQGGWFDLNPVLAEAKEFQL